MNDLTVAQMAVAATVAFGAGLVKGMVGFAMPMIMISLLSSVIAPELALAGLILPTLATNGWQALRQGPQEAWETARTYRRFMAIGLVVLLLSAQLVAILPTGTLLTLIGLPIVAFSAVQLMGWVPTVRPSNKVKIETVAALIAGFTGGLSGVWGPPTVAYFTIMDTPKTEQIRAQGVIYGLGAIALLIAHILSGVMTAVGMLFSLALILPAMIGMTVGLKINERIDQQTFRRATLVVLLIVGLNLIRRGVFG